MTSRPHERELQLQERVAAAGGAAFISSILVNPLDVVKTRMQAQAANKPRHPGEIFSHTGIETRRWALTNGLHNWPLRNPQERPLYIHRPPIYNYRSTLDGILQIVRKEGFPVLYRGMDLNLLVAVPLVCLYLPAYDALSATMNSLGAGYFSPLLAGSAARTAAVLLTSPFELVKTRLQSGGSAASEATFNSVWRSLALHEQPGFLARVQTLWTGVGATLLKDVPFAALFWTLHEPLKHSLAQSAPRGGDLPSQVLVTNVAAGAAAGALASGATTPFDVVKTHMQTLQQGSGRPLRLGAAVSSIIHKGGMPALFAGWAPRAIRGGVAYSILMGSYEQWKLACSSQPGLDDPLPVRGGLPTASVAEVPEPDVFY